MSKKVKQSTKDSIQRNAGRMNQKRLANIHGVSQSTVSKVTNKDQGEKNG